jgi:gliding motility-associated-like protein
MKIKLHSNSSPRSRNPRGSLKFLFLAFLLFFAKADIFAQTDCANSDFSSGNFTNWSGSNGDNDYSTYTNIVNGMIVGTPNSNASNTGRQTLMNQPGTDYNTGNALSVIPPGGSYSCRLGNDLCSSCEGGNPQAERMTYTYTVTSTSAIFTYQYAVVLQDPSGIGHSNTEVPKFTIYVLDAGGNLIDPICGKYEVIASSSIPGFQTSAPNSGVCSSSEDVVWKDWTSVSIDLSGYIGQQVSIQFTTYDCALGGHFGYAYISAYCGALNLTQQCYGDGVAVYAPPGFATYSWTLNGAAAGTGNPCIVPAPVAIGDTIKSTCTSFTGCSVTLWTLLEYLVDTVDVAPPFDTICSGYPVSITASSANNSYSYSWSNGMIGATITVNPTSTTTYTVTGTSGGSCFSTEDMTINVNPLPVANAGTAQNLCKGSSTTISASASTGAPPLSYSWSGGQTTSTITVTPSTTTTYTVTVTNGFTCTGNASVTVNVYSYPNASVSSIDVLCNGESTGSATITPSSGTPPYTYTWNTSPPQYTPTASGIPAGNYSVYLSDTYGCDTTYYVTVSQPAALSAVISASTNPLCYLGSSGTATVTPSGGVGPYTYVWQTNPPQYTQTATGLSAGTGSSMSYSVAVTDANGCVKTNTVTMYQPTQVMPAITNIDSAKCFGTNEGVVTASASGGTGPYTYLWSNSMNSATISNLFAGTYTVTITDHNGCTNSIDATVYQPDQMIVYVTAEKDSLQCYGQSDGFITLAVQYGTPPYAYSWNTNPPQTTLTASNLPAGTYSVTITDLNGCSTLRNFTVWQPPELLIYVDTIDETCEGWCDGQLTSAVGGGTPPYAYAWSTGETGLSIFNLCTGTYGLTVTDSRNCKKVTSNVVGTTTIIDVSFTAYPTSGYIPLDVSFTYTGSVSPNNQYQWTFGDNGSDTAMNPNYTYTDSDTFPVWLVVTEGVCKDSAMIYIYPEKPSFIIVPNVFTPNGDGFNEFYFQYNYIATFDCLIFNRWGRKIYEWNDISQGWDGKTDNGALASDGVYFYIIKAKGYDDIDYEMHGYITLIK